MINVKPEVLAALEENTDLLALLGGPHIYQLKAPEGLDKYITLFELTNFDSAWADGTAFTVEVHLQVDVWVKGASTSPIAAEVDKTMKALGFNLLGHSIVGGVMLKKATDVAPYVALGFMSKKSNGQYRYIWLTKGMFALPDQEYATGEDKPKFQTPKLKGTFVKRAYDDLWQRIADEDHPDYVASIGANWFNSVEGTANTTPPTVTVVPANNATGVAVGSAVNWTFSEAILASLVTDSNFFLIKDSDGSAVAGTLSINTARTVVTFTPGANLSAATAYRAICTKDICDLAGNRLAANSVTKFTTA